MVSLTCYLLDDVHFLIYFMLCSAEAVAGMIHAELTGGKWTMPEWFPEHYLTANRTG